MSEVVKPAGSALTSPTNVSVLERSVTDTTVTLNITKSKRKPPIDDPIPMLPLLLPQQLVLSPLAQSPLSSSFKSSSKEKPKTKMITKKLAKLRK